MTMKKIILLTLMLCNMVSVLAYDFEVDGIYYNITSESKLTVEVTYKSTTGYYSYHGCLYSGAITIPESVVYNGKSYTVTGIGAWAFGSENNSALESYFKRLTSIAMPSTIEYIGDGAFCHCDALSSLIIPSSVKDIYGYSTLWCTNCKFFVFLSSYPPKLHGSNPSGGYALYIPGEIIVPQISLYLTDSKWNHEKDGSRWGGFVEMLSPSDSEFEYNGQVPIVNWTNNLSTYTMNVSDILLEKSAGNHSANVKAYFYSNNDMPSFSIEFPYEYTINKAKLNVKAKDTSRVYGDDNPSFNNTYSGFVNGENESVISEIPTISTPAIKTSNVGEYPITVSGGSAANYEFVYEPGILKILKAQLSAKVNDTTKVYGKNNPSFTIDYYGLKNGEIAPAWTTRPTIKTEATLSSGVGQYEVNAVNGVPVNYDLSAITAGTLSVTPAPLTIKAKDATRQYYSDDPNFSYTCQGFVNGDNENVLTSKPSVSTSATQTSNVGTYEIKVGEAASPNYSISYVNGTLTITPRTLTTSVGNYDRIYNEENPTFEVNYDGFAGNDDVNSLREKPTVSTTATKTSDVGTYPITISGGSADNYQFSYTSGTLTINKAEQNISWEQDLTGLKVGDQVELKAAVSSGLPVTYTMDYSSAAEIYTSGNKSYLDCKAGGQFPIRAVQNGNKNYYSSPRASNTVSIIGTNPTSDPTLTIKQADNGSVKVQVSKGSVYTFTIAPSHGWRVHSVTFNNSDVTNQLNSGGSFTTPTITSNSTLSVVFEQGSSSVNATRSSNVKIMATSEGIKVVDANMDDVIRVYTTDGLLLHSVKVDSQTIDIPLTKRDVYIIKVGEKTVKLGY